MTVTLWFLWSLAGVLLTLTGITINHFSNNSRIVFDDDDIAILFIISLLGPLGFLMALSRIHTTTQEHLCIQ